MIMREFNTVIEEFLKEIVKEDAIKVYRGLLNKKNVSEFDLAEELKLNINAVRNILYSLHEHNLVSSIRKKDKEKGWYIYYWTFSTKYAKEILLKRKKETLDKFNSQISEDKTSYKCPDNHVTLSLEEAMDHGFKCIDCEKVLVEQKKVPVSDIKKWIDKINEDMKIVEEHKIEETEEDLLEDKKVKRKPRKKVVVKKTKKKTKKKKEKQVKKKVKKQKKKIIKKKLKKNQIPDKEEEPPKTKGLIGKIRKKVRRLGF